jgi:hypothetical protein
VNIKRLQLKLILHIAHADTTNITAHAMDSATMTGTAQVHARAVTLVAAQIVNKI